MKQVETKKKDTLYFRFYSKLKNEDADPYSDRTLLVAADGLGGSGSTVHHIDREKHKELAREIYETAFGDLDIAEKDVAFRDKWLKNRWLKDMADEKDDTSALWASRIVIGRFVYMLTRSEAARKGEIDLSDEKTRAEIFKFVRSGLENVADHFDLKSGKYSNQLILPTTLAAIRYKESENEIFAEAVWAGDSRCYALTLDGLFALSDDDEDGSGAINNLFYVGDKAEEKVLHYKSFKLPKPCVLMTVSDGVFDPYDPVSHFGVEAHLLKFIRECNNSQELSKALCMHYDEIHGDDTTMAFSPFGFKDYQDLKAKLAKRTDFVLKTWNKYQEFGPKMPVLDMGKEAEDYVRSRTSTKYNAIVTALLKTLEGEGEGDIAAPETLKEIVGKGTKKTEEPCVEEVKDADTGATEAENAIDVEAENARILKRLELLSNYMKIYPKRVAWKEEEKYQSLVFSSAPVVQVNRFARDVKMKAWKFSEKKAECKVAKESCTSFEDKKTAVFESVVERIGFYRTRFDELREELTEQSFKWRERYNSLASAWGKYEISLRRKGSLAVTTLPLKSIRNLEDKRIVDTEVDKNLIEKLNADDQLLLDKIKEYTTEKKKYDAFVVKVKACDEAYAAYEEAIKVLMEELAKKPEEAANFFQEEIVEEFRLRFGMGESPEEVVEEPCKEVEEEKKAKPVDPMEVALSKKDEIVEGITQSLGANYDKVSVIDVYYNSTRLAFFREYCKQINNPETAKEVALFKEELQAFLAVYESLL